MESLLPASGVMFEHSGRAAAPSKDYLQLIVTSNSVVVRVWKVSLRRGARLNPRQAKLSHEEFLDDERTRADVRQAFGDEMLAHVVSLASGNFDYLPRLPLHLACQILQYLSIEDLARLSKVSTGLRNVCESESLWHELCLAQHGGARNELLAKLGRKLGWKKLFFTDKLTMQKLFRREMSQEDVLSTLVSGSSPENGAYTIEEADAIHRDDLDRRHVKRFVGTSPAVSPRSMSALDGNVHNDAASAETSFPDRAASSLSTVSDASSSPLDWTSLPGRPLIQRSPHPYTGEIAPLSPITPRPTSAESSKVCDAETRLAEKMEFPENAVEDELQLLNDEEELVTYEMSEEDYRMCVMTPDPSGRWSIASLKQIHLSSESS